jgi:hypothetical protein
MEGRRKGVRRNAVEAAPADTDVDAESLKCDVENPCRDAVMAMVVTGERTLFPDASEDERARAAEATTTGATLAAFASSEAATRAILTGGEGDPEELAEPNTWKVVAPGFGGRLFFIGPECKLNPVSTFRIHEPRTSPNDDGAVTIQIEQLKGEINGSPPGVIKWINAAYTSERTVTTVVLDPAKGVARASVDVAVRVSVPRAFKFVPLHKIEKSMKKAFRKPTEKAMGEMCDAIGRAYVEWAAAGGK